VRRFHYSSTGRLPLLSIKRSLLEQGYEDLCQSNEEPEHTICSVRVVERTRSVSIWSWASKVHHWINYEDYNKFILFRETHPVSDHLNSPNCIFLFFSTQRKIGLFVPKHNIYVRARQMRRNPLTSIQSFIHSVSAESQPCPHVNHENICPVEGGIHCR
jgi:hypothetical protein